LYKRVTKIFAISTAIKKNLIKTTPNDSEKVMILPNGIDIERFSPERIDSLKVRRGFGFSPEEIVLGMLARFTPGKGHEEFLLAAKDLNDEYKNLRYLVVGEPSRGEGEYADRIKQLAKECRLENLVFTGYREDIPEVLAAMDIFVFPSHAEAFGIALIEAMAMEKPSVCTNAEGILDIAVDGQTSYLFENKNAEDLKAKLRVLIESKITRGKFGENARNRVAENFELTKLTEKVLNIYQEEMNKLSEENV